MLYHALHLNEPQIAKDDISNVTMREVVAIHNYNDLGMVVNNQQIILVEARSTWSVNIVFRALPYLAETWNNLLTAKGANIYSSIPIFFPAHEIFIFVTSKR